MLNPADPVFLAQLAETLPPGTLRADRLSLALSAAWLIGVVWDQSQPSALSLQVLSALGTLSMLTIAAMLGMAWVHRLLHRRLGEQCPALRLQKTGRGSFRFDALAPVELAESP